MRRIILYFKESVSELRKVVWPTREIIIRHTLIVIASVGVATAILMVIDLGLSKLVGLLVGPS